MLVCVLADVANGFDMLPLVEPVHGDNFSIECKANSFVFGEPKLFKIENDTEKYLVNGSDIVLEKKWYSLITLYTNSL